MKWFVDANVVDSAIKGSLINEDNVEVCPETISCCCLDENVCIESCRKYLSPDAWVSVKAVVKVGKSHPIWYCGQCRNLIDDDMEDSIVDDSCLKWFHFHWISLKSPPKSKLCYCPTCDIMTDKL